MIDQLLNFLIQPMLGGAAGYITNEYAIDMLFNEYTKLKIGGVIPKTRNEFIENISLLIEKDILNKEKVSSAFDNPLFINSFEIAVNDFFTENLYSSFENKKIGEIACLKDSVKSINDYATERIEQKTPEFIDKIAKNINFFEIIDQEQTKLFISKSYDFLIETLEQTNFLEEFTQEILDNNKHLSISHILGEKTSAKISSNLKNCLFNTAKLKEKHDDHITKIIKQTIAVSEVEDILNDLLENILKTNKEKINIFLANEFKEYMNSSVGKKAIQSLSSDIISFVKNIDLNILELLNDNLFEELNSIILGKMPNISSFAVNLINDNEDNINQMIEESLEEVINDQDMSKKTLLNMAKGGIMQAMTSKGKITSLVEESLNDENLKINISHLLISYLKLHMSSINMESIVEFAQKNNILDEKILTEKITTYFENIVIDADDAIANRMLDILKQDYFKEVVNNKLTLIIKENFVYSENIQNLITNEVQTYVDKVMNISLKDVITTLDINTTNSKSELLKYLKDNKEKYTLDFHALIYTHLESKTLSDFIEPKNISNIKRFCTQKINSVVDSFFNKTLQTDFHQVFDNINNIDNIHANSFEMVKNSVIENLEEILGSFIKNLSQKNLTVLSNEELSEMAKRFIGTNLQPISTFGGMLGATAGLGLALANPQADVASLFSLSGALTFAGVGFLTNIIAITMLFRPYEEIKALSKVPFLNNFSQGYIAKNKSKLADGMSDVIYDYLLAEESVGEFISANEKRIKKYLVEFIEKNNYDIVDSLIKNQRHNFTKYCDALLKNNQNVFSQAAVDLSLESIKNSNLIEIIYKHRNEISKFLSSANLEPIITESINKRAFSNKYFDSIIPAKLSDEIKESINPYIDDACTMIFSLLDFQNIVNLSLNFEGEFSKLSELDIGTIFANISSTIPKEVYQETFTKLMVSMLDSLQTNSDQINTIDYDKIFRYVNPLVDNFFNDKSKIEKLMESAVYPVSLRVKNNIKAGLNFLAKSAYEMMDGDSIVDKTIEKFMVEKLPIYLFANSELFSKLFKEFINDELSNIELKNILTYFKREAIINKISEANDLNCDFFVDVTLSLSNYAKNNRSHIKLKELLSLFELNSIKDIFIKYQKDISSNITKVRKNIEEKADLSTTVKKFKDEYFEDLLRTGSTWELMIDVHKNDIVYLSSFISSAVTDKMLIFNNTNKMFEIINQRNQHVTIFDFVEENAIALTLQTFYDNVLKSKENKTEIKLFIEDTYDGFFINRQNMINAESLEYVVTRLSNTIFSTLNENLYSILRYVRFDKMAKEQINDMDPKRIHEMFDSFAGKYFRQLKLYGILGGIFGINVFVGAAISASYGISKLKNKKEQQSDTLE